ncbi:50S ribosomal protein P1 [Candidatus Woesearchaeota archaeon]|nr:50S ribosomal protein P1 [Candidatus Woesearchaeota archaeon]
MEYVYAALLIHKAGGKIDEANVKKVLEAAGFKSDEARIKALVSALANVNIDEAVQKSTSVAAPVAEAPKAEKKEEKKEEKVSEEQAAAGLSALFG